MAGADEEFICWNPNDLYFRRSTSQNKAFSNQNKGHLGSRYIRISISSPPGQAKLYFPGSFFVEPLVLFAVFLQVFRNTTKAGGDRT